MGRTYQSHSRSPSTQIPQQEEIPNVMSPGRVTQIGSSMGPTYQPVSRSPSASIPQREETPNVMSLAELPKLGAVWSLLTNLFQDHHPLKFNHKKKC